MGNDIRMSDKIQQTISHLPENKFNVCIENKLMAKAYYSDYINDKNV